MNADHLSYQRATSISIIGLAVQLVLGLALLLYGIYGEDPIARSGAFVVFFGAPVWLALALVFHQHKRERIEASENEAYRSGGAAASVFGDDDQGETVQADKLAWMHRFFLPGVSLILAAAYIATGLLRFGSDMDKYVRVEVFEPPSKVGLAIAVGVALLVICFILARFVAGMAKQKAWSLLHAGAAASVGSALIGALLLIAHALELGQLGEGALQYGPVIVDALMIFLGAEIVLNFILTLYRPRKAGEYLRPAFDSRLLAFLAAPDRLAESVSDAINYQLGFDVSSTWFYKLVSRSVIGLSILTVITLWGMTCFAVVEPGERGLLHSAGGEPTELEPGLVFKKPWPFARVDTFAADSVTMFTVGAVSAPPEDKSKPLLWGDIDPPGAQFMIAQASTDREQNAIGGEVVVIIGEVPVHYAVTDLSLYTTLAQDGPANDPEAIRRGVLKAAAKSIVARFFLNHAVDELLGPNRGALEDELRRELQRTYDTFETNRGTGAGVEVLFAGLQSVRPPQEVAPAYENVNAALYTRQATVEQARAEQIYAISEATGNVELAARIVAALEARAQARDGFGREPTPEQQLEFERLEQRVDDLLEEAGGSAAVTITVARADRWTRHLGERSRAILSEGQSAAFNAARRAYTTKMFVSAMRESTSNSRVWISTIPLRPSLDVTEISVDTGGLNFGADEPSEGQE